MQCSVIIDLLERCLLQHDVEINSPNSFDNRQITRKITKIAPIIGA